MLFTIKLAGIPVQIESLFPGIYEMSRDYLTEEAPVLFVHSSREEIYKEFKRNEQHIPEPRFVNPDYLETLSIYRRIAEQLVDRDILLFHGSVIAVDGSAYLFTAASGTGKSTHTRLWREVLPPLGHRVEMVNDDKPLLRFTDAGVLACGTPWNGKHNLGANITVPLSAICFLHRGETNRIAPVQDKKALTELMRHAFRPDEPDHSLRSLTLLERLADTVSLYELRCNMEPEAALVSFRGMVL